MLRSRKVHIAVFGAAGLLALVGLILGVLHTPAAKQIALRQAVLALRKQGIGLEASKLDYSLFSQWVEMRDVRVQSLAATGLPPIALVDRISVQLDLRRALSGEYHLEDAVLKNLRVQLFIAEDGRDNIPRPPGKTSSQPVEYLVKRLGISGGEFQFEDRRQQVSAVVPIESVQVTGDPLTRKHHAEVRIREGGRITRNGRSLAINAVSAQVNFADPRFDLSAQTMMNAGSVAEFGGLAWKSSGDVNVAVTAAGALDAFTARVRVRGDNLALGDIRSVGLDINAGYNSVTGMASLDSAEVSAPWAKIRARGDADLSPAAREGHAHFSAAEVDLARASALLGSKQSIASIASAEGDVHWPGLRFEDAEGAAVVRTRGDVDATARVVFAGNRLAVNLDDVRACGVTLTGQVALSAGKSLAGEVKLSAPHLATSIAGVEEFLGYARGTLVGTPIDGSLSATAQLAGTVQSPTAAVQFTASDIASGDFHGVTAEVSGNYAPAKISIQRATLGWQNQVVSAEGTIGLGSQRTLQLAATAERVSIPEVLAGLGYADLPLTGQLNLQAAVNGTTEAPYVSVAVTGRALSAYRQPLGDLRAEANIQGHQLAITGFHLAGDGLQASAGYDLDSRQYQFEAQARDFELTGLTLPDGSAIRGRIRLDATSRGTVGDPSGKLKFSGENVDVAGQEVGRVEAAITVANQRAEIEASIPRWNLIATGDAGLRDPYPARVQVRVNRLDVAQLPVKLEGPIEGVVSALLSATGELKNVRKATARMDVSEFDIKFRDEPVHAEPFTISYSPIPGAIALDSVTLTAAGSQIQASGVVPLDSAAAEGILHVQAKLDLPGLARLLPSANLNVQGTASVSGDVRGTFQHLDPNIALSVESPLIGPQGLRPAVSNVSVRGRIQDGALDIESASATWGGAAVTVTGVIPFAVLPKDLPIDLARRPGPARLRADIQNLDLAKLDGAPEGLQGSVSAHLEAEAEQADVNAIRATLSFPELRAKLDAYSIAQDGISELALKDGVVEVRHFKLAGPATAMELSGSAHIGGSQAIDLHLDGQMDASVANMFTDAFRTHGPTEIHAAVGGSLSQPQAKGYVQVADGQFAIQDPRVAIEGLNLRVDLEGDRATIARLDGQMNGGSLSGRGSVTVGGGSLKDSDVSLRAQDVYLDYPAGLKTISDIQLQLKSLAGIFALRGTVLIKEGRFTDDLNFDTGILAAATAPRGLAIDEQRNPLLDSVRFNIGIVTQDPITIQNNLAKAEVTTQLVLLGSPYEPGLAGRLIIEEGSELTLQERRYQVSRGIVTFTSERRIEPNLNIEATTTVPNFDVTLRVTGTPGDTKTELSSNPVLPEPDILALLVTGKTLDEIRGQEFQVAQAQVLSYVTGRVGSSLGRQVEKVTGLSRVRVEPSLIAAETNPGARLTIGQDFTRQLHLVYSMDLVDSSDQIWVVEYDVRKRFVTRGARQSDGSFRLDFHHDLHLGGGPGSSQQSSALRPTRHIGQIAISGNSRFPESQILQKLKVQPGDRYDFFKLRKGLDRVDSLYIRAGLLESNVRLHRQQTDQTVNLNLKIDPGPRLDFVFEGAAVPKGVRKQVGKVWGAGVFDSQRSEDAAGVLRSWLIKNRYLTPAIQPRISTPAPDEKRVLFDIERGPRSEHVEWVFEGARGIEQGRLRKVIESQGVADDVHTKPSRVTEVLTQFYREMGYLDASVERPHDELNAETHDARIIFPVKEGPLYRVGTGHFTGNRALTDAELAEIAPLPAGEEFRPVLRENAVQRLRDEYWARGYNDVTVDAEVQRVPDGSLVDLNFRIVENARGVVSEIVVEGNRHTSEGLIRSQVQLKPGDPVNLQRIGDSRRKLYNTGAFAAVEINREDLAADATAAAGADHPVRLRVKVEEVTPFDLRYGGYFDTERGPGGMVEITNHNLLGGARVVGLRGRYDSELHEARLNFSEPLLTRFPIKTVAGLYLRREITATTEEVSGFNTDRFGVSAVQEATLGRYMLLNYGYKIERSHTYDTGPDPFFDVRLRIASLNTTLTRDTRDDLLDASRGSFLSQAVQLSPETLGSQVRFIKYFGQYFRYFPLQKPKVELFTNRVLRPRLVFATGARVGLGTGLGGQEIPLSERFFAGGSTTIRGFAQSSLGPTTGGIVFPGGNALLVLNNELRFPMWKYLDGVGFVDAGNVYRHVSDFSLSDLRSTAGFGVRVRTPWFLLRLDYGLKLDRRPGESMGRLFFSIGQAF
ncbi:MAG: translocation/assembly module TamB domain-containing protein [Candidatus Solibacter sp.]